MVSVQKPREIAGQVLRRHSEAGDYIEILLDRALAQARLSAVDRALCQELVYGVVRWQAALDWLISQKTDGRDQKGMLQILLRLGLYQIFWLNRIPDHAAVNETVELAKAAGFGPQAGFVNAVLRGYLRDLEPTREKLVELKQTQPAVGYSHPEWLVERWQKRWGAEKTRQLLDWNNTPPRTFARINSLMFGQEALRPHPPNTSGMDTGVRPPRRPFLDRRFEDAGDVLAQWRDENVSYDFVRRDWIEDNVVFELKSHPPLAGMPSFQRGLFYVQDPSTLVAPNELDPQPGETVLDLCAAPGGKTTYMAQLMENRGRLLACDNSPDRLKLLRENRDRLGAACVEIVSHVGAMSARFDRILVDAPCSNTGVMRRRVDSRWRIRPEEIGRLQAAQTALLNQASILLKPGGTLVYSTCSLEPEENREVVDVFLRSHSDYQLDYERQLLPFTDNVDGAYVATLARNRPAS